MDRLCKFLLCPRSLHHPHSNMHNFEKRYMLPLRSCINRLKPSAGAWTEPQTDKSSRKMNELFELSVAHNMKNYDEIDKQFVQSAALCELEWELLKILKTVGSRTIFTEHSCVVHLCTRRSMKTKPEHHSSWSINGCRWFGSQCSPLTLCTHSHHLKCRWGQKAGPSSEFMSTRERVRRAKYS